MWNPFKKKSAFNCDFYDKPKKEEVKKEEKPKEEKKKMATQQVCIRRGKEDKLSERLTNINFGIYIDYDAEKDAVYISNENMQTALLMDIRAQLIESNKLLTKLNTKPKKEKKTRSARK